MAKSNLPSSNQAITQESLNLSIASLAVYLPSPARCFSGSGEDRHQLCRFLLEPDELVAECDTRLLQGVQPEDGLIGFLDGDRELGDEHRPALSPASGSIVRGDRRARVL